MLLCMLLFFIFMYCVKQIDITLILKKGSRNCKDNKESKDYKRLLFVKYET